MTEANNIHSILEQALVDGRAMGALTDEEDDRLLESMGDLWEELTEDEQAAARERAAKWAKENS